MAKDYNFANREVANLTFVEYGTQKPFLPPLNYANVTTTEITGESVFAYGGQGHPRRIQFTGERGGTLTIETQIQTFTLYQLLTGGERSTVAKYLAREELTVSAGNTITLSATPSSGAVVSVFKSDDDCGTPLGVSVEGTTVTVTGADESEVVIAYYLKDLTDVQRISIKGDSFPKAFTVYGETVMKTEDDQLLLYKLVAHKCSPQSNLTIGMSNNGDPATLTITCDLMTNQDNELLDLILEEKETVTA